MVFHCLNSILPGLFMRIFIPQRNILYFLRDAFRNRSNYAAFIICSNPIGGTPNGSIRIIIFWQWSRS